MFDALIKYNTAKGIETYTYRLDVFSTFLYANIYAGYLIILFPLLFNQIKSFKYLSPVVFYSLYLTKVRGALIILFLTSSIFKKANIIIVICFISLMFVFKSQVYSSIKTRLHYNKVSVQIFKDNPLGIGLSNYSIEYQNYKDKDAENGINPHNAFLQMFAEAGFISGLLFLLMFLYPIYKLKHDYMCIVLLNTFIHAFTEVSFYAPNIGYLMFLVLFLSSLRIPLKWK
jgi:O-antigen ligase